MKRKFLTVIFFLGLVLSSIAVLFLVVSRSKIFTLPIQVPFTRIDDVASLNSILEKTGLVSTTLPVILDSQIIASISGFRVIFAKDNDLATQVRALQLVLPSLKIGGTHKSEIDLRFTKVIVR